MTDQKKKLARALQALLQLDGVAITTKEVVERIEDIEISVDNLIQVKDILAKDIRKSKPSQPNRRAAIGEYITNNWEDLKTNEVIKNILLNAYCQGRYSKDQRDQMIKDLLAGIHTVNSTITKPESSQGSRSHLF